MQRLAFGDIYMWSVWQPDRNVFFNSHFIRRPSGNVVIDPLFWHPDDEKQMADLGGVGLIVVTNRDHERKTRDLASVFGAQIAASERDATLLSGPVDVVLRDGDRPFDDADVIAFEGLKSPGEIAISLPRHHAAIVGDALWGDPAGSVRMLPDDKLLDVKKAIVSLRRLWGLNLDALLVGDGASILHDADRIIGDYLQSRREVYVNRINFDELRMRTVREAGEYAASVGEIGRFIGARRLGYWLAVIEPNKRFCPLHSHQLEEEVFVVLDGEPTIRTPRGEFTCRRGDVIAFPVGDVGAHQLLNKSDKPCTVFLLGNDEPEEVAYYPDSDKLMIDGRERLIIKASPRLDYYEGEV